MDVIVIHGYSSNAASIRKSLGESLLAANAIRGNNAVSDLQLHYADYVSLDDQVQLEDVAEALFLELQSKGFLKGAGRSLHFIVHSTGGLVIRQLLKQYDWMQLKDRVASIVFVAPANFGSPLAAKGKSQLGRLKTIIADDIFGKDEYVSDLDFGEVGEQILTDLEMAAPRQWELSDFDLFDNNGCIYHSDGIHAVVLVGAKNSDTLARVIADLDGTDGVIVTSGAGLNVRRLYLDVTQPQNSRQAVNGWDIASKKELLPSIPQIVFDDLNHGTILTDQRVCDLILDVLKADTPTAFEGFTKTLDAKALAANTGASKRYQQFVLRVVDDRGKPVVDYDLSFNVWSLTALQSLNISPMLGMPLSIGNANEKATAHIGDSSDTLDTTLRKHAYAHSRAKEYRRFLIDIDELNSVFQDSDNVLTFSIIAYSSDKKLHYATERTNNIVVHTGEKNDQPMFFYPHTTTQVSVVLDRYSDSEKIVRLESLPTVG